jgi:CheY-like chemotaxis protein
LLDINMPGMSGWEFLEAYSKLPEDKKKEINIVMLTSSLNPDDKIKSLRNPDVKEFINKPITVEKVQKLADTYFPHLN